MTDLASKQQKKVVMGQSPDNSDGEATGDALQEVSMEQQSEVEVGNDEVTGDEE
jgi:hypothetical protein